MSTPSIEAEAAYDQELEGSVRIAYATALRHTHDGGQVAIYVGAEVREYLIVRGGVAKTSWLPAPSLFGFPLLEDPRPRAISVHVIHTITS